MNEFDINRYSLHRAFISLVRIMVMNINPEGSFPCAYFISDAFYNSRVCSLRAKMIHFYGLR